MRARSSKNDRVNDGLPGGRGAGAMRARGWALLAFAMWIVSLDAGAQALEPRRWTHLPTGLNVAGVGIGAADGVISLDPVLRIEDATFKLYTVGTVYTRTFEWLGKSSRIDFRAPWASGRWEGIVDGEFQTLRRHGFADPSVRFSMHLLGAPPLRGRAFLDYRAANPVRTSLGAAVSLTLPWGEYFDNRLINLGANRLVVRPSVGVLHQRGPWEFELTGSVSFYGDNDAFFGGTRLEQEPRFFLQGHVIRGFGKRLWVSASAGYSFGGEATVNGVAKDNDDRTRYFALSVGTAFGRHTAMKLAWATVDTNIVLGTSSDAVLLTTIWTWGGD